MATRSDPPGMKIYPAEIFSAILIDDEEGTATSSLSEPLLSPPSVLEPATVAKGTSEIIEEYQQDKHYEVANSLFESHSNLLGKAKFFSGLIGFIVGCFIQFSSLGANFLLTSLWGYDVFFQNEFIILSLLWCFGTSIMGVLILLFLRGLVVVAFRASTSIMMEPSTVHHFVAELIVSVECSFAVSSLIGVCLSWTMTDILLDMKGHIIHSLVTLAIALAWCKVVMMFCSKSHQDNAARELLSDTSSKDKNNSSNELTKVECFSV